MNVRDRLEGAIYGTAALAILGQVPPFTAFPEEIFTLPTGALVGGLLGARALKRLLPRI